MTNEQLTFFGGLETTGGVHILFGAGKKALFFDFGIAHYSLLDPMNLTKYNPVRATTKHEIRQYVLGKMAPPILTLYDSEQLGDLDPAVVKRLWPNLEFPQYDQIEVFYGHNHQDHMALLPYARKDMPVYMHRDAYALYKGLVKGGHNQDTAAKLVPCDDLSVIDLGDFTMQIVELDHNSIGASAIVIESKNYKIAFTGDWRRHGRHPERIDRFIDICSQKGIDLLITEATLAPADSSIQRNYAEKEEHLLSKFASILAQAEGLVYIQMAPRDLERMADMISIAAKSGRKVVMEASQAAIWHTAITEGVQGLKYHSALNASIQVIDATVTSGMSLPYETITLEKVAEQQHAYLYFFKFPDLAHMIEIETLGSLPGRSHFVQADYSVKIDHADVAKYLKTFAIKGHTLGNGGHAHHLEISDLIERISPKAVIPLHSWHPKNVDTRGVHPYYPTIGETISVADLLAAAKRRDVGGS